MYFNYFLNACLFCFTHQNGIVAKGKANLPKDSKIKADQIRTLNIGEDALLYTNKVYLTRLENDEVKLELARASAVIVTVNPAFDIIPNGVIGINDGLIRVL